MRKHALVVYSRETDNQILALELTPLQVAAIRQFIPASSNDANMVFCYPITETCEVFIEGLG